MTTPARPPLFGRSRAVQVMTPACLWRNGEVAPAD
jgi:hypothetical protein